MSDRVSPSTFPRVLIGITTRNRADILPKAIASAQAQAYPHITVAVTDDASTDATGSLRALYPTVRWLRHETPQGYMANRNALMQSQGFEYYVSLDDDAWFLRGDEIALAIDCMEADSTLAGIAFDILSPDRSTEENRTPPRRSSVFIGCGHLLRLNAVQAVGYYASTPGPYGAEEKDLALRLADRGFKILLMPGVHVWHDKAWTGRDWYPLHRSGVCNELYMTLRRCPMPDLLFVLPLKILRFLWFWIKRPSYFAAGFRPGIGQFVVNLGTGIRTRQPVRRSTFWNF